MRNLIHEFMAGQSGIFSLTIVFRKDNEDGGVIAECIEIPGCLSQGETEDEAKANITDAIDTCLSVMLEEVIRAMPGRQLNLVGIERQVTVEVEGPRIYEVACA